MEFDSFVLAAATADLREEHAARNHADAIEYRLDLAKDGMEPLHEYDGETPLIVTNRVEWEGGQTPDRPERLDALETAVEQDAVEAIDVELAAIQDGEAQRVVDHAAKHDVAVIVSTHDFEATPDRDRLEELLRQASEHGDVGKLAVTAESADDVLDLLAATRERTVAGDTVATMAMGEAGRHSRAVATLYGSKIGYAPVDPANATAPGQYDLATLRELVTQLQQR